MGEAIFILAVFIFGCMSYASRETAREINREISKFHGGAR